jgi:4-amino-4-deoxy-L-arabinose transferase-like glycosyltransferase
MSIFIHARSKIKQIYGSLLLNEVTLTLAIGILIAVIMASHLYFLTSSPTVFIDEPWYANAAWNWLKTGNNFDTMHTGTYDQYGLEWIRWPIIGNFPWRVSFALFGLGLFQARLVSWFFGVLLILVIFIIGYKAYGKVTGILAALLLSLSPPFYQASHYARPDIMLAAVGLLSYLIAITAFKKDRWYLHFLAGLSIGLALDIHQNAILYMLGIAALYMYTYKLKFLRQSGTWLCALGGLIGVGFFAAFHLLPNPNTYFTLLSLSLGNTHQLPIQSLNPLVLLKSLRDEIGRYHFYENSLDFALIGASFVYFSARRSKSDRSLLVFVCTILTGFVLIIGSKHDIYAILLYPLFILMVADTLLSLIKKSGSINFSHFFAATLLGLFFFNGFIHFTRPAMENRHYNYYSITTKIQSVIPSGARVMGLPNWWLGLAEYDYRSSLNLTFYHILNGYSLNEGLEAIHPDFVIVDNGLRGLLVDNSGYNTKSGFDMYKLPRNEFDDFLKLRAKMVLEFTDPWQGYFEIYEIDWNSAE